MIASAIEALKQVFSPLLRGVLLKSVLFAVLLLVVLAIGIEAALRYFVDLPYPWVETVISIIAGLGLFLGALYLVPAVSAAVAGLFLDDVAEKVEAASYPADPVGKPQPMATQILYAARFFGVVLAVNLGALLLLLVPGVNIVIFYVANAYLLSREYFEMVAMRHRTAEEARALRQANAKKVFLAGLLISPILLIPIVNLIMPVFGTAFMVHFHRRLAPLPGARERIADQSAREVTPAYPASDKGR